jgi:retron-type reverse transcriptase
MEHVLSQFKVHSAATAYRKGRSIVHNAKPHTRGNFVLKMDFKDFFPSLKSHDFSSFLKRIGVGLDDETVQALCRILFWRPKGTVDLRLAIGAPSSPLLSNILMMDFDRRVSTFCAANRVTYTRYADDLTFSARQSDQLRLVESAVLKICRQLRSPSLTINQEKTVRVSKREARRVTGLVLTNDRKVSLGRNEKRRIRASVHHFASNKLDTEKVTRLRGMLAYVNSVEPDFLVRLRKKYGADTIQRCLEWSDDDQ